MDDKKLEYLFSYTFAIMILLISKHLLTKDPAQASTTKKAFGFNFPLPTFFLFLKQRKPLVFEISLIENMTFN